MFRTVDAGGNPDVILRAELLAAAGKNEDARTKLLATERLRQSLLQRLQFYDQNKPSAETTAAIQTNDTAAASAAAALSLPPLPPLPLPNSSSAPMQLDSKQSK